MRSRRLHDTYIGTVVRRQVRLNPELLLADRGVIRTLAPCYVTPTYRLFAFVTKSIAMHSVRQPTVHVISFHAPTEQNHSRQLPRVD